MSDVFTFWLPDDDNASTLRPLWTSESGICVCTFAAMFIYQLIMLTIATLRGVYKFFLMRKRCNLLERYGGPGTYVAITGASSGMGRILAHHFAELGFNLLLIGHSGCEKTKKECIDIAAGRLKAGEVDSSKEEEAEMRSFGEDEEKSVTVTAAEASAKPETNVRTILCDFGEAAKESDFFAPIEAAFEELDVGVLINNVGQRFAWDPYHEFPKEQIEQVISVGALTQARMTQIALKKFKSRSSSNAVAEEKKTSAVVFITAMGHHPGSLLAVGQIEPWLTVPYLAVYEAANQFGFYHANSVMAEYGNEFDFLNITPGAVFTENTKYLMRDPVCWMQGCHVEHFCANIVRFLGRVNGIHCAYWGHALSMHLLNILPFGHEVFKSWVGYSVGKLIASQHMEAYPNRPGGECGKTK
ncbi:unnamed protein product [Amoebophrya sp. A25]|nr:unnamed protein product [Amoebophrya sp. A25]|eukprot:GSA25T00007429001.1